MVEKRVRGKLKLKIRLDVTDRDDEIYLMVAIFFFSV